MIINLSIFHRDFIMRKIMFEEDPNGDVLDTFIFRTIPLHRNHKKKS